MPKNRTEWMHAASVTVQGHARPRQHTDEDGEQNSVACLVIQRKSGIGTLVIEGRPEDLLRVAAALTRAAEAIETETNLSPALRSLYGRV
jgi:hypothetical protein